MLSPVTSASPVEVELPKFPLNSSKDDAGRRAQASDFYSSHKENVHIKFQNRDGDTLELKSTYQEENFSHKETREMPGGYSRTETGGVQNNTELEKTKAWVGRMKEELKQQQLELLKVLLNQKDKQGDSDSTEPLVIPVAVDVAEETVQPDTDVAPVPEYWNAENTSNRIVQMATGFAKISGLDPVEFAEIITAAVEEGFSSAHEVTGDLPGAAGKLNKDTHDLVQSKLKKWLDDWQASAYNQTT